jgi:nucleoside-diphosphate-sugar epimerase
MQRVLVSGTTGFLGGFVAREFKDRGYFVRALARSPKKLDHLWDSTDEIIEGEVTRSETLEHICDEIDVVFSSIGITRHQGELLAFFTTMATTDVVAPATGTRTLEAHYRALGGKK